LECKSAAGYRVEEFALKTLSRAISIGRTQVDSNNGVSSVDRPAVGGDDGLAVMQRLVVLYAPIFCEQSTIDLVSVHEY
jgi:hypothetical protein